MQAKTSKRVQILNKFDICENSSCELSKCKQRHPKECKFYRDFQRCKFNPCKYRHIVRETNVDQLIVENRNNADKISEIESILCERNNLEEKIKKYDDKITEFELKIESLEKEISKKNDTIESVEQHNVRNNQKK